MNAYAEMPIDDAEGSAQERFLCFAYGSNMLTARLTTADRAPSARAVGTGYVEGYRLTFAKVSRERGGRCSGKCDIEPAAEKNARVYGVLFSIARADEGTLDQTEGPGYTKITMPVITTQGSEEATVYVAVSDRKDTALQPYGWYKGYVLAGAIEHGLPDWYVNQIRAFTAIADPDDERRTRNEAALAAAQLRQGG